MKRILLTGCAGAAATNFTKCVKESNLNYEIIGTDVNEIQLKASIADIKILSPRCDESDYIPFINKVADQYDVDLIYPQTDQELEIISNNRSLIKRPLFMPNNQAINSCRNKFESFKVFSQNNIPVAKSELVRNTTELKQAYENLSKSYKKMWFRAAKGAGSRAAIPIEDLAIATEWMNFWKDSNRLEVEEFLLSEYLPHKDYAFQSVWYDGKLVTSFARQRLQYMFGNLSPSNQSSSASVAISVHNDLINKTSTEAIKAIDDKPHGVYCVDLKENSQNVPCITEINIGRFFTTCDFAMKAGCNMPEIFLNLFFNEKLPPHSQYNAIEKDLIWIRNVDREPTLIHKDEI